MSNLNRAQRRAQKYNKPLYEKVIRLPKLLDEFTIFDTVDRILDAIERDYLEYRDNIPVILGPSGSVVEIIPVMEGWIYTWKKINPKLDLNPWVVILSKLTSSQDITIHELERAKTAQDACKIYFRGADREKLQSIAKTAQIAIFMKEDLNE